MLLTNEWLDKIAASHADFTSHGMLANDPSPGKTLYIWIHSDRQLTLSSSYNLDTVNINNPGENTQEDEDDDGADVAGPSILAEVALAKVPSKYDYI